MTLFDVKNLSDVLIRSMIAEYWADYKGWDVLNPGWFIYYIEGIEHYKEIIPEYTKDLNAIHEVWKSLIHMRHIRYDENLKWVVYKDIEQQWVCSKSSLIINANARQRAEALLLTIRD